MRFRQLQYPFFAAAIALLGYYTYVQIESQIFQQEANRQLEQAEPQQALIGRIEIPRLKLSAIVMEGTAEATLKHAVGHILQTGVPGQPGNIGLAAHRDTFFRPLKNIKPGDIITLRTTQADYRYQVVSTRIVKPTEVSVLDPNEKQILTLVTCHPFHYIGNAPNRFIVRAERQN